MHSHCIRVFVSRTNLCEPSLLPLTLGPLHEVGPRRFLAIALPGRNFAPNLCAQLSLLRCLFGCECSRNFFMHNELCFRLLTVDLVLGLIMVSWLNTYWACFMAVVRPGWMTCLLEICLLNNPYGMILKDFKKSKRFSKISPVLFFECNVTQ